MGDGAPHVEVRVTTLRDWCGKLNTRLRDGEDTGDPEELSGLLDRLTQIGQEHGVFGKVAVTQFSNDLQTCQVHEGFDTMVHRGKTVSIARDEAEAFAAATGIHYS